MIQNQCILREDKKVFWKAGYDLGVAEGIWSTFDQGKQLSSLRIGLLGISLDVLDLMTL